MKKKIMCLNRRAPYGTIYALESLELLLVASAFEQTVSVVFIDDGVYQLLKNQCADELAMKSFSKTFLALADFGVEQLYVSASALKKRQLRQQDLLAIEGLGEAEKPYPLIRVVDDAVIGQLMAQQSVVFSD